MRFSLYPKLILLMLGLALIPVGFAGVQLIGLNQRGIQAAVLELQTKLARTLAAEIGQHLRTTDDKVRFTLAALSQDLDWAAKQKLLEALIETHPGTSELSILDAKGRELLKVYDPAERKEPVLESHAEEPAWRELAAQRRRAVRLVPGEPAPRLVLYYPLQKDHAIHLRFEMRALWERIQEERVGGTGRTFLVDARGEPVVYPAEWGPERRSGYRALPIVRQALVAPNVGASQFRGPDGVEEVGAYAPVEGLGGAVLIVQPRREAYAAVYEMRQRAVVVLAVFGVLALLVSVWTARQLAEPVFQLTRGAEEVAKGHFDARVVVDTDDELKDLAETFNYMTLQLKRYADLQVERVLAEQRRTEAILFTIADGILLTDYEGRIQLANRMARSMLGLPLTGSLEGRSIYELLPDTETSRAFRELLASPEESQYRELDLSSDVYRRVVRVSAQEVRGQGGEPPKGVVAALHDVTLEKEIEKLKEDFIHSMTHDLRSPMASLRGFLELLLKEDPGPLTPSQRRMVEAMDKASFRLLGMINNILDMAKMKAGRMEVQLLACSLGDVARRVKESMHPLALRKRLRIEVGGGGEGRIKADPDLLERVFVNLLSNAIRFSPEEGRVAVDFEARDGELRVSVSDEGPGIPEPLREKVFERFEQGRERRGGGTGLGLAICKHIVEAHRGRIWAEAAQGGGSRFVFSVPRGLEQDEEGNVMPTRAAREPV